MVHFLSVFGQVMDSKQKLEREYEYILYINIYNIYIVYAILYKKIWYKVYIYYIVYILYIVYIYLYIIYIPPIPSIMYAKRWFALWIFKTVAGSITWDDRLYSQFSCHLWCCFFVANYLCRLMLRICVDIMFSFL